MPILIIGDLHLDRWLSKGRDPFSCHDVDFWRGLDGLILAGDISDKPKVRWAPMLAHIRTYIPLNRVHVFPGNHDFYHHVLDGEARLANIAIECGASYVQKRQVIIGSTRFLCCTLWTDFAINGDVVAGLDEARSRMNDYKYIRMAESKYRKIRPEDTLRVHQDHLRWLEKALTEPFDGSTVVVTHHGPAPNISDPNDRNIDPAYTSDLSEFIFRHQPQSWLFGHTHFPAEATFGRTEVRNVSLGYPDQIKDSDLRRIFDCGLVRTE